MIDSGNNAWTKFRKRIPINASSEKIYNAIATQDGLEKWFLRKAEFETLDGKKRGRHEQIEKGDKYHWLWHGHGDDEVEEREILECDGKSLVQFLFSGGCRVTIAILEDSGENLVELIQEDIVFDDDPSRNLLVACGEGWTFYLANLKSYLEGGIDLRNKNEQIKSVINA